MIPTRSFTPGRDFSAKHFRTWGASVIAFEHVVAACRSGSVAKLANVLEPVAAALGNTPSIARKSYVHPFVLELKEVCPLPRKTRWLSGAERALITLLDDAAKDMSKAA